MFRMDMWFLTLIMQLPYQILVIVAPRTHQLFFKGKFEASSYLHVAPRVFGFQIPNRCPTGGLHQELASKAQLVVAEDRWAPAYLG